MKTQTAQFTPETESRMTTLLVHVIFTDVPGTLAALREAAVLARGLGASIQILYAEVVPFPVPVDQPIVDREFVERRMQTIVENQRIPTTAEIRLCRNEIETLCEYLPAGSRMIIGGRKRWLPSRAGRIGRALEIIGHHVLYAR